jgi:hypothetical protein
MDSDSNFLLDLNPLSGEILPDDPLNQGIDALLTDSSHRSIKAKTQDSAFFDPLDRSLQPTIQLKPKNSIAAFQ